VALGIRDSGSIVLTASAGGDRSRFEDENGYKSFQTGIFWPTFQVGGGINDGVAADVEWLQLGLSPLGGRSLAIE